MLHFSIDDVSVALYLVINDDSAGDSIADVDIVRLDIVDEYVYCSDNVIVDVYVQIILQMILFLSWCWC